MFVRIIILGLIFSTAAIGQQTAAPKLSSSLKGRPQVIETDRVYVRMNGRNIGERTQKLTSERYDANGRITEFIEHGVAGYVRTVYSYSGAKRKEDVGFFDLAGNPINETEFKPAFDYVKETDLCLEYSVRREEDQVAKISREYEICVDGSTRATTVDELNQAGDVLRSVRVDAKSRRWESCAEFDANNNPVAYRFTVAIGPSVYTHVITYSDSQVDANKNWIRLTATAYYSTKPDDLAFQYNEYRRITYYPEPKN